MRLRGDLAARDAEVATLTSQLQAAIVQQIASASGRGRDSPKTPASGTVKRSNSFFGRSSAAAAPSEAPPETPRVKELEAELAAARAELEAAGARLAKEGSARRQLADAEEALVQMQKLHKEHLETAAREGIAESEAAAAVRLDEAAAVAAADAAAAAEREAGLRAAVEAAERRAEEAEAAAAAAARRARRRSARRRAARRRWRVRSRLCGRRRRRRARR